jgi:DNA-binding beta-propeller fold protein YncE
MKNFAIQTIRFALCAAIMLMLVSCASTGPQNNSFVSDSGTKPVWPQPPKTSRIQYVKSLTGPADAGIRKTWYKKTIDTIFGKDEFEGIILRPYGVFVDADRIYVTDPGLQTVHVFDLRKQKYLKIRKADSEGLVSPIGIAVDEKDNIFITDSAPGRVFVFDREGNYLREIGSADLFRRPSGIAVFEDRVYVVDTHNHHVLVFSKEDGSMLFSFGRQGKEKGEFNYPTNISISRNGNVYISDSMNFRAQVFDRNGKILSVFGKHGDGSGDMSKPKGISVDSEGHIYISDAHFDNVQIFDGNGEFLLDFGNTGSEEGQMILPAGIFIDGNDRIYVADSYNRRVQIFQYLKENK